MPGCIHLLRVWLISSYIHAYKLSQKGSRALISFNLWPTFRYWGEPPGSHSHGIAPGSDSWIFRETAEGTPPYFQKKWETLVCPAAPRWDRKSSASTATDFHAGCGRPPGDAAADLQISVICTAPNAGLCMTYTADFSANHHLELTSPCAHHCGFIASGNVEINHPCPLRFRYPLKISHGTHE